MKVPLFIQGGIHGNEYEGVDAAMQRDRAAGATTPYGTDPEVDQILDHAVVVFNPIQNPDGRVARTAGERQRLRPQPRLPDPVAAGSPEHRSQIMQEWLSPELLDLHGYVTPTLIEATTKPHNPGIEYDLWLKWNQSRIDANEAAMNAQGYEVTRPINDWCCGRRPSCRRDLHRDGPRAPTTGAQVGGELGRLGPVLHPDVLAARRPERLDGRDVQPATR